MVLYVDSDVAHLVIPRAHSQITGKYHLSNHPKNTNIPTLNGPLLVECKTIRAVITSVAEAEIGGIFHNAHVIILICAIFYY